ncbi:MAG: hypothetical protein HZB26_03370 [Candidatus Hydrogenedentes bacterium]|nr:hypothetical protein [Candidatus Hydrogenedentota bacterium]
MTYLIWKVETSTGQAIRAMPVLFTTLEQAHAEASALNDRFQGHSTGYKYVAKEARPDLIQSVAHAERILESH